MKPDVSTAVIHDLKERMARLSLLFLGQHLWSLRLQMRNIGPTVSLPSCCLCHCCDEARKAYQIATGIWPTNEHEQAAMREWGSGMKIAGTMEGR